MQKNCEWTYSRAENSNQRASVYIITFFRLSMTKCLLVKWRHYALNAHQLCVLIPIFLITLLCLHISRATGVASPLGWSWFLRGSQEPDRDEGKAGGRGGAAELILARATAFWEELDLSDSQLHLAQDTGDEAPGQPSWPTQSKTNRWRWIFSRLLGSRLPLAISKNLLRWLSHS